MTLGTLARWLATLGPVGLSPVAPGTMGTLVAVAVVGLAPISTQTYLALLLAATLIGTAAAHRAEREMGRKDPGAIVIDEFAGYMVAMLWLPATWPWLLASFVLFRVLDIFKPWPIGKLQDLKGGLGIMADDLAAGALANAALQIWMRYFVQ